MAKTGKSKGRKSRASSNKKSKRTEKTETLTPSSGIDKSRRLLRSTPLTRARGKRSSNKKKEKEIRNVLNHVCNKPMPPLSELEKMYDSDDEMTEQNTPIAGSDESQPPEQSSSAVPKGSITPTTAKKYADEILKILDDLDTSIPPPIIPMKKYKKAEVPYIVGCSERPRIPENPNCNVFKGDDYGITSKTNDFTVNENEDELKTPGFYNMNPYSLSKSAFNAQANEIASKLLSTENNPVIHDTDSDDTVVYEVNSPNSRFSPKPSTSKDHETIFNNDRKFRESFLPPKKNNGSIDMNIEEINDVVTENDTLNIDVEMEDSKNNNEVYSKSKGCSPAKETSDDLLLIDTEAPILDGSFNEDIEIIEHPTKTITIDENEIFDIDVEIKHSLHIQREDKRNNNIDLIEILDDELEMQDVKVPATTTKCNNTIKRESYENDCPINVQEYKTSDPNVVAEIDLTDIDIENVILDSQSLIDKYSNARTVNIVKARTPEAITVEKTNNTELKINNSQTNSLRKKKNVQNLSNFNNDPSGFARIIKNFFDKRENTSSPRYQVNIPTLFRNIRIFPQLSLNNSPDGREVNNIPYIEDNSSSNERFFPQLSLHNCVGGRGNTSTSHSQTDDSILHQGLSLSGRSHSITFEGISNNFPNSRNDNLPHTQTHRPITSYSNERISPQVFQNSNVIRWGNSNKPHTQAEIPIIFRNERVLPQVSVNSNVNRRRNSNIPNPKAGIPITPRKDRRGNGYIPHAQITSTLTNVNILPQVSVNNSVTNNISNNQGNRPNTSVSHERLLPEPPLNNNLDIPAQSKRTNKRKRKSKNDNNQSTNNLSNTIDVEPRSPSIGLGTCPICLHELSKEKIASTTCGHLFCLSCISTSLQYNKQCPACRKKLTARGYHPIFL